MFKIFSLTSQSVLGCGVLILCGKFALENANVDL